MKCSIDQNSRDMVLVAQVFSAGSISAACQVTGLERTSLSRRLSALESRLGVSLFDRTGQRISLTHIGDTYLKYCYRVLELVENAQLRAAGQPIVEHSVLKIIADFEDAGVLLSPMINDYSRSESGAEIVTTIAPDRLPEIPDDASLVIQVAARRQPGVRYENLGTLRQSFWACSEFAEPSSLSDPRSQEQLPYIGVSDVTDGERLWRLSNQELTIDLPITPRFRLPSLAACRDACASGLGVAVLPDYLCRAEELAGKLVRVFPDWCLPSLALTAAYRHGSYARQLVGPFVEFCITYDFELTD